MRRPTRREWRIGIVALVALALFAAFLGFRLHRRTEAPNPLPESAREISVPSRPQSPRPRRPAPKSTSSPGGSLSEQMAAAAARGSSFAFGPDSHTFVSQITGSGAVAAIGYKDLTGTTFVRRSPTIPFTQRARIHDTGLHVIVAAQVGPAGGSATCTIRVDGRTVVRRTATGPQQVVVCSA